MEPFTVETITEPVADADLAALVESLAGLWRDDAGNAAVRAFYRAHGFAPGSVTFLRTLEAGVR